MKKYSIILTEHDINVICEILAQASYRVVAPTLSTVVEQFNAHKNPPPPPTKAPKK